MKLTVAAINSVIATEKKQRFFDGLGLYLEVSPAGSKLWRFKYRFGGMEKVLSLGQYPLVTLKMARAKHLDARKQIEQGIDPGELKKIAKSSKAGDGTFAAVAMEWVALKSPGWSPAHRAKTVTILEKDILPFIGKRPIGELTPREVLVMLKRIDQRSPVTARKALSTCHGVFIHGIPSGLVSVSPMAGLSAHLSPRTVKRMASPDGEKEVARLMRALDAYQGTFVTLCALKLSPLFFVRPGTLRGMEWQDIYFDKAEWRIPIEQLKRKEIDKISRRGEVAHIVPLCEQAMDILKELHQLTGDGVFVFPGARHKDKCMSSNTVRTAIRSMGFTGEEITPHGFRHMASTMLHEMGYQSHLIEKQMAHCDRNRIRGVYNHAEYLAERKTMMQAWADYLDKLKRGAEIIPIQAAM
jgi:integrase